MAAMGKCAAVSALGMLVVLASSSFGASPGTEETWPTERWQTATTQEAAMDSALLAQARDYALAGGGSGMVVRHGKVVVQWGDPGQIYDLKSSTKAIGVTAVGLALMDGKFQSLYDPASKYHPDLGVPPETNNAKSRLAKITLFHLATQTAGFDKPGGYTELLFEPGTKWSYSDGGPNWLAECVTLVYGRDLQELMFERVFSPIGIGRDDLKWRANSYRPKEINGVPRREFGAGISANVDAMARIGYLYLRQGRWKDAQIIPSWFVDAARTVPHGVRGLPVLKPEDYGNASDHYGLLWWNNADGAMKNVPRDAYWAWGLYDSLIVVIPSLDIVVSRAGKSFPGTRSPHYAPIEPFIEPIALSARQEAFEWQKAAAEAEGMSSRKLDEAAAVLAGKGTKTFLVVRNDKIVCEWYAPGFASDEKHYTASMAKALVGGVSLMVALNDGRLSPDDPACTYIPEWKGDPQKSKITIRHLATHSSGIEDAEQDDIPHSELPGWKGQFWKQVPDPFSISRDEAPVVFEPGSRYAYSNPGMAMLSYAVTAGLRGTEHTDIRTLLRERIMRPIGVPDTDWSVGYGRTYRVGDLDLVADWGGGSYTARAVARVGRLMLRKGNWQGRQLVDPRWVEEMVKFAGTPLPNRPAGNPEPASGLGWWTNHDGVWTKVPRDAFAGAGAGNQVLLVVPSLDLIIVRNGSNLFDASKGEGFWAGIERYVFNPVMEAIAGPPYPPSEVIKGIEWAPANTVIRKAEGSDNWPITWADDDNLYTAYGDGWGFGPKTDKKLSLGLAKIVGGPSDFTGANIRTQTGERVGQGEAGLKAGGILCVDGILYMIARNAGNAQIAWSADHAQTWEWCDWRFETSFGAPTFLNFGRDYAGARDGYVYLYSSDSDTAYQPADRMVLARVARERIRERGAYEFFKGLDDAGQPLWTRDIGDRGAVFVNPGRCYRSGVSYNPGLKRYLWCQVLPESTDERGPRYQGGFGIYEAPEPWGPWRTAFYTEAWDIGPGETSSFPTKWMSEDGRTCHLVFSGDDCFSVRKATLR